ncbi:MAG: thymidine phosphorylase [Coriobacteriia bacterium]
MRSIIELIESKRDGHAHTREELEHLVAAFVSGEMPDYQMAAWLMAAFLNGLDADETVALTRAMAESGRMVDLSSVPGIKVDKHSTGGVGDKTTLVLAPLVASCGVRVAKMSGRGLGHTGGTLDKLESIPGFSVTLGPEQFLAQVRDVGVAVIAQSDDVDPADKKMYALRDVTGTVPCIPLIVASIISKKVAGCADAIVLDVKVGSGAFMKTETEARALAAELTRVGAALGRKVVCVMSDMDQPLGRAVGNALEVCEAVHTLKGAGPDDLTELCVGLGAKLLVLADAAPDENAARGMLTEAISSGRALQTFRQWVTAQGGDVRIADDPTLLPLSEFAMVLTAKTEGYVTGFDAEGVGRAAMLLGAGRETRDDVIDPGAGLVLAVKDGDHVDVGDPLATLYSSEEGRFEEASTRLAAAIRIGPDVPTPVPLFHEV